MDDRTFFDESFAALTGNAPFPWQRRLFQKFCDGVLPAALELPTGLGKTSVMAIWYLAFRANAPVPRRLVYVVDRRVVVEGPLEASGSAFLVATAAGEVGIDLDADHIVCDLVEWERMVQVGHER